MIRLVLRAYEKASNQVEQSQSLFIIYILSVRLILCIPHSILLPALNCKLGLKYRDYKYILRNQVTICSHDSQRKKTYRHTRMRALVDKKLVWADIVLCVNEAIQCVGITIVCHCDYTSRRQHSVMTLCTLRGNFHVTMKSKKEPCTGQTDGICEQIQRGSHLKPGQRDRMLFLLCNKCVMSAAFWALRQRITSKR